MSSSTATVAPIQPDSLSRPEVGTARIAIGLLQGLLLYLLYHAYDDRTWPATQPLLFGPVAMMALLVPVIVISALGHMSRGQIVRWASVSAVVIAALTFYDVWRVSDAASPAHALALQAKENGRAVLPSPTLIFFLHAGFFIAHSLVMAAARDRRRIASYESHFELAWKFMIQLAFCAAFVGVVWLTLHLGSGLFMLVKLSFLRDLIGESWFSIPVTAFAFSCAMHLTDVRPAIVHGIRTLLLVLMSWVLPVITLIVGGFLFTLPFTGLDSLWATRHATATLLGAAATFVVLINAAWQDGTAGPLVAKVIRLSARAASVLLVPIVVIAIYALVLRVNDYGWTVDRCIAAACLLVASCYAAGYAAGALRSGWLPTIARVNLAAAFLILAVLLLMFSPVGDPARLSVNNQVERLASGKTSIDKFDFKYLRFEAARYGRDALAQMHAEARGSDAPLLRERIAAVQKLTRPWDDIRLEQVTAKTAAANLTAWPAGSTLPESFRTTEWAAHPLLDHLPGCLRRAHQKCDAFQSDLTGDGKPEILLIGTEQGVNAAVFAEDANGTWNPVARLPFFLAGCKRLREELLTGNFRPAAPTVRDLMIGGRRVEVIALDDESGGCTPAAPPKAVAPAPASGP